MCERSTTQMKIEVIASTKVGYALPKEEALDFQENQQESVIYLIHWKHCLQSLLKKLKEE